MWELQAEMEEREWVVGARESYENETQKTTSNERAQASQKKLRKTVHQTKIIPLPPVRRETRTTTNLKPKLELAGKLSGAPSQSRMKGLSLQSDGQKKIGRDSREIVVDENAFEPDILNILNGANETSLKGNYICNIQFIQKY